jgi:hypothetical protein
MRVLRVSLVSLAVAALGLLPFGVAARSGLGAGDLLAAGAAGLAAAVDAVGWVLLPQLLLAIAILSLGLQQLAGRLAGTPGVATPGWLDPAVESALLLGLLGTISGMVRGFVGASPDELQPGPLVHSLGTALRSSGVGFGIALVGVWVKALPGVTLTEGSRRAAVAGTSVSLRGEVEAA